MSLAPTTGKTPKHNVQRSNFSITTDPFFAMEVAVDFATVLSRYSGNLTNKYF